MSSSGRNHRSGVSGHIVSDILELQSPESGGGFDNFTDAGHKLLDLFKSQACDRLTVLYPAAPTSLVFSAADGAIRIARRYNDCSELSDDVLHQAMRTTVRHGLLGYDATLNALGGRVGDETYKALKAQFCAVAAFVAREFEKPRPTSDAPTACRPSRRRTWPPRVGA